MIFLAASRTRDIMAGFPPALLRRAGHAPACLGASFRPTLRPGSGADTHAWTATSCGTYWNASVSCPAEVGGFTGGVTTFVTLQGWCMRHASQRIAGGFNRLPRCGIRMKVPA
jgi:hypothetical protein